MERYQTRSNSRNEGHGGNACRASCDADYCHYRTRPGTRLVELAFRQTNMQATQLDLASEKAPGGRPILAGDLTLLNSNPGS